MRWVRCAADMARSRETGNFSGTESSAKSSFPASGSVDLRYKIARTLS